VEQLEENLGGGDLVLSGEVLRRIDAIDEAIPNPMKEDGLRRL
jgi:aryl-alcohol dehydrogenase-like predicted oxidoreductase